MQKRIRKGMQPPEQANAAAVVVKCMPQYESVAAKTSYYSGIGGHSKCRPGMKSRRYRRKVLKRRSNVRLKKSQRPPKQAKIVLAADKSGSRGGKEAA